jgi:hypothetical protein
MSNPNPSEDLGSALKRLTVLDWVLIVLCWPVALILGIVAIVNKDTMRGILLIALPFVIGFIVGIIFFVLGLGAAVVGGAAAG